MRSDEQVAKMLPCGVGRGGRVPLTRRRQELERTVQVSHPPDTILDAMRHTTFRFALAPTPAQAAMLADTPGRPGSYNQCLRLVTDPCRQARQNLGVQVPWQGLT